LYSQFITSTLICCTKFVVNLLCIIYSTRVFVCFTKLRVLSRSSRQRDCGFTHRWCPSVCPFVCPSVCRQNAKTRFSQKV